MYGFEKAPPFQNVGASQVASLPNLPLGLIYDGLLLKLGGTFTKAQITNLKLQLGGKTVVDADGSELDTINAYMGRKANAAYLPIWFSDPNARTVAGENLGAIDTETVKYRSFSLRLDIGAATNPTLECFIIRGARKIQGTEALIRAYLKAEQSIPSAARHTLTVPTGLNTRLLRAHIFASNMTQLDVKQNGFDVQGDGDNGPVKYLQDELRRVSQSGHTAFDPVVRDNQSDAMALFDTAQRQLPTKFEGVFSGSETIEMISEVYGTVQGF